MGLGAVEGDDAEASDDEMIAVIVERLETRLVSLGTVHNRKYDAVEREILDAILQDGDGKRFERGHEKLGWLLGYEAGNDESDAAPDPWWKVDTNFCFVFEDHAGASGETEISATKARQASSHPTWLTANKIIEADATVVPVLVTPSVKATSGAFPHLQNVRYWNLVDFRAWAQRALAAIRDLRREFPGEGDLFWRANATKVLQQNAIAPKELEAMLARSAADLMTESGT